jgi:hypothetical protein
MKCFKQLGIAAGGWIEKETSFRGKSVAFLPEVDYTDIRMTCRDG